MALTAEAVRDIALGRGGSYSLSSDVLTHNLFDVRAIPATFVQDHSFFSQGIGAPIEDGVKAKQETNLADNGKLPTAQTFLVKRIGLGLTLPVGANVSIPTLIQHYTAIIQHSLFQLKVQGRDFDLEIHGRQFAPAVAATGLNAATIYTTAVGDYVASGYYSLGNIPIFLDSLVGFTVPMSTRSANSYVNGTIIPAAFAALAAVYARMSVTLEGVLTRSK
jgi:hypothetical protein